MRTETAERIAFLRNAYDSFIETGILPRERYADDFVWDMSTFTGWPEKQVYLGHAGATEFLDTWRASWDDWKLELTEVIDSGGDDIVAVCRQEGRAKDGGVLVEMTFAMLWTVRDGKFARQRMYTTKEEALAALGVSEARLP
jgi:ketosteroid isomerase-like protein